MTLANLPFIKMHGLGNDFVVVDARARTIDLSASMVRTIADRHTGVGCDQFIVMEPAKADGADVFMRIRNADGTEVEACGNATRCIARLMMSETGRDTVGVETVEGVLRGTAAVDGLVTVDMGPAKLDWTEIPLAGAMDTLHLGISHGPLADPVGVSVGNPHAVFFVDDAQAVDMETLGPVLEHHPLFPQRTNVEAVQVINRNRLRMRVWERGVGVTRACGTGACATLVAAVRRGLSERTAEIVLDGGSLKVEWRDDNRILMTGPAAISFSGTLDPSLVRP